MANVEHSQPERSSGRNQLDVDPALSIASNHVSTGYDVSSDDMPRLQELLRAIYKRRWIASTAFLIVFVSVVVYTFTVTPIFEARARLLIESEDQNVVSFKEVVDEGQGRTDYYQTQYTLLQSRSLAQRTLEKEKLWNHPLFGARDASEVTSATLLEKASGWFTSLFRKQESQPRVPSGDARQASAIDALVNQLGVAPVRNSRIVDLTFRSPDSALAARVVNGHAKSYIEQNLEFKFMATKEASDWLGEQLTDQRQKVEDSEAALQRYREQNDAISVEDRENIVVQKLTELNTAVTRAKTDRIQREELYNQLTAIQDDRAALDTFPAILANGFIQEQKTELATLQRQQAQLGEKFGERHPEMMKLASAIQTVEARLRAEIEKAVQSVRNEFLAARAQESSLVEALESQKREALGLNRKGIEYGVIQRDVESNRQIYQSLLQRAKETGVSGELKTSNIRIVDLAEVPRFPVSPRKRLNLLLGFLAAALLGLGLPLLFEYIDDRVKTPDEIKTVLGLPFIGMIPKVGDSKGRPALLNAPGVVPHFVEAFRSVRTGVLFSSAEPGQRLLVVTSTEPGEGKTVVSCNLAIALAQAGERVLLIDGDLRRPKVHESFGLPSEPGLSNLLVGNADAFQTMKESEVSGLWTLPAGRIPPNPAELLGSRRFKEFLASLHDQFDWIVIDSPPVMAVTDVSVIAHTASEVLFVVGAEMVSRHAAQLAVEQLESANAKIVGAVLNQAQVSRNPYYYRGYYSRGYSRYYQQAPGTIG